MAHVKAEDLTLLQLKRLELARTLALEPRILLMDEIGAGLVESEVLELIEVIKALRHRVEAIVIIEHIMDVITECSDRVAVLDFGRLIADGPVQKVLAEPEVVSCYLGTGCEALVPRVTPHEVGEDASPILRLEHVSASYGHFKALTDIALAVHQGEVIALLGTNGAGKTTAARVISGMIPAAAGRIRLSGKDSPRSPRTTCASLGWRTAWRAGTSSPTSPCTRTWCSPVRRPEGWHAGPPRARLRPVRRAGRAARQSGKQLSGGQQQMLAIGRSLMADPDVIIFDEIALGLAPATVDRLYDTLVKIRDEGTTMILIEQNVERGLSLADRVFVLEKGTIALGGTPDELRGDPRLEALYMGEAQAEEPAPAGTQREERDTGTDAGRRRPSRGRRTGHGRQAAGGRSRPRRHPGRLQGGHGHNRREVRRRRGLHPRADHGGRDHDGRVREAEAAPRVGPPEEKLGVVVIGTVQGDIHDIGKDIVVTMLDIAGFDVIDLGVDVKIERFIATARRRTRRSSP